MKNTNPHILKIANALELTGIAITVTGVWEMAGAEFGNRVIFYPLSGGSISAAGVRVPPSHPDWTPPTLHSFIQNTIEAWARSAVMGDKNNGG